MTLISPKSLSGMKVTVMASIVIAAALTWACGGSASGPGTNTFNLTGNWEIVLNDGRVTQSIKGSLVQTSSDNLVFNVSVSDVLLNAYGPGSGTCPQGWPTTPPGNTRLSGTISLVACFLCDSPQYPLELHVTETDPAQGGLQVADIKLSGAYYKNIDEMSGSWSGTMIACTGMDSSGGWDAKRQP